MFITYANTQVIQPDLIARDRIIDRFTSIFELPCSTADRLTHLICGHD